jgi:Domain of unknown function (DUF4333)
MSTPRGPERPSDPEEPVVWGRPPAGGWGDAGGRDAGRTDSVAERTGAWSPEAPDWEVDDDWQPDRRDARPDPRYDPRYDPDHDPDRDPYGAPAGPAQYAGSPGRVYPAPRRRRSSRLPLVLAGVAVLVLALVGVLGFVTPGFFVTRVLDPAAVQEGVQDVLSDDYGVEGVADVTCPADVEVVGGAAFECRATVDGDAVRVPVLITNDDAEYQVGRPL